MTNRSFIESVRLTDRPVAAILSRRGTLSEASRLGHLGFLSALAFIALGAYIYSVNAIMLDGAAIQDAVVQRAALADETTRLEAIALKNGSPAWLTEASTAIGLVAVGQVRFLDLDSSFALSLRDLNSLEN